MEKIFMQLASLFERLELRIARVFLLARLLDENAYAFFCLQPK